MKPKAKKEAPAPTKGKAIVKVLTAKNAVLKWKEEGVCSLGS